MTIKKLLLLIGSSFLMSFCVYYSDFDKVINQTSNQALKSKLIAFRNGGIEKPVLSSVEITSDSLIHVAMSYLNTTHRMGGTSHHGIDCSGLVHVTFKYFGAHVPHSSHEQARFGKIISERDSLQRGDQLFFYNSYHGSQLITHTGFYLGEDKFIHTSASLGVVITPLSTSSYWNSRYLFATRNYLNK